MTWKLERFGSVVLPTYNPETPIGTGPTRETIVATHGGFFDAYGDDQAPLQLPYDLPLRVTPKESTVAALLATLRALKAMRGTQGRLYRRVYGGEVEWCWARVAQVPAERQVQHNTHQPVEIVFRVLSCWYGMYHAPGPGFDDGLYFDDGVWFDIEETTTLTLPAQSVTVNNGGDTTATNVVVRVTAGDTDITALELAISGVAHLVFALTIAATKTLVIDCGSKSILNDGVAAGINPTGASHHSNYWLPLEPGDNTVAVGITGGLSGSVDPTISFEFSEPKE